MTLDIYIKNMHNIYIYIYMHVYIMYMFCYGGNNYS